MYRIFLLTFKNTWFMHFVGHLYFFIFILASEFNAYFKIFLMVIIVALTGYSLIYLVSTIKDKTISYKNIIIPYLFICYIVFLTFNTSIPFDTNMVILIMTYIGYIINQCRINCYEFNFDTSLIKEIVDKDTIYRSINNKKSMIVHTNDYEYLFKDNYLLLDNMKIDIATLAIYLKEIDHTLSTINSDDIALMKIYFI